MREPLLCIWDNPGAHAEFPRALPTVVAFRQELRGLMTARLYELHAEASVANMTWKVDFLDVELGRREEAKRVLKADGGT